MRSSVLWELLALHVTYVFAGVLKCAFEDGSIVDYFNTARVHGHIVHGGCPRATGSTSGGAEVFESVLAQGLSQGVAGSLGSLKRVSGPISSLCGVTTIRDHTPDKALHDTESGVNPSARVQWIDFPVVLQKQIPMTLCLTSEEYKVWILM